MGVRATDIYNTQPRWRPTALNRQIRRVFRARKHVHPQARRVPPTTTICCVSGVRLIQNRGGARPQGAYKSPRRVGWDIYEPSGARSTERNKRIERQTTPRQRRAERSENTGARNNERARGRTREHGGRFQKKPNPPHERRFPLWAASFHLPTTTPRERSGEGGGRRKHAADVSVRCRLLPRSLPPRWGQCARIATAADDRPEMFGRTAANLYRGGGGSRRKSNGGSRCDTT